MRAEDRVLAQVGRPYPYLEMESPKYQSDTSRCASIAAGHRPMRPVTSLSVVVRVRALFEPKGGVSWMRMLVRSATYVSMALLCIHACRQTHGKLLGGSGEAWEPLTNKAVHSHSVIDVQIGSSIRAFARKLEAP
jgi:hypothetical protein